MRSWITSFFKSSESSIRRIPNHINMWSLESDQSALMFQCMASILQLYLPRQPFVYVQQPPPATVWSVQFGIQEPSWLLVAYIKKIFNFKKEKKEKKKKTPFKRFSAQNSFSSPLGYWYSHSVTHLFENLSHSNWNNGCSEISKSWYLFYIYILYYSKFKSDSFHRNY